MASLWILWSVLSSGSSLCFYDLALNVWSPVERRCTSSFSKLGETILKNCTLTLWHISLTSLQAAMGCISLTADTWSNQPFRSYLAVTTHWVAEVKRASALQLKVALIVFHWLWQGHTGKSLARALMYLLDRACITVKVRQQHSSPWLMDAHYSTR